MAFEVDSYVARRKCETDSSGRFLFGDLGAGVYQISAGADGDESVPVDVTVKGDEDPEPVEIRR